jgi:hypothetical protein
MILNNKINKPVKQMLTLLLRNTINPLHMRSHSENTLPSRYGIRTDDRVFGAKLFADILGGTARTGVDLEVVSVGYLVEARLGVCSC